MIDGLIGLRLAPRLEDRVQAVGELLVLILLRHGLVELHAREVGAHQLDARLAAVQGPALWRLLDVVLADERGALLARANQSKNGMGRVSLRTPDTSPPC
eukprot:2725895-Pyramimonas_sp.AAC.1